MSVKQNKICEIDALYNFKRTEDIFHKDEHYCFCFYFVFVS